LTGARSSSLYLLGEDGTYRAVAAHGISLSVLQEVALTSQSGLMKEMCVTREPVQVLDFRKEVQGVSEGVRSFVEQLDVRATLGVPLVDGEECVGALYIAHEGNEPFSDDAVRMLRRLAAFAQVAVRNAERYTFLQTEQNRLQGYVDAIPEGVLVVARDGTVALANAALQRELGARQPLRGVNRHELFSNAAHFLAAPVRFRFDHDAAFDRVLSSGQPEQGLLEVGAAPRKFEVQYSPLQRPGGEIEGVVATMRDISSPLELQSERARTHLLSELLSLSAHLNSELSIPVLIERVVEAAMELVGASAGTLGLVEGDVLVFRRYHLPGGWADFQYEVQRGEGAPGHVWETGKPYITNTTQADEYVLQPVRQRLGFKRLAYVPVFDRSGKIIGTLGVYDPKVERDFDQSDIEALQLLAHQAAIAIENARLSELKDEFLSIVSHELKTPVTSIKGFTQILHRRLPDEVLEGSRRYLDVINHQADRLTGLINDLLDLSRIQTGRFVFDVETIDYGELVRDVLTEMRLISPGLSMTYAGPEHLSLRGNADRIRQVLVNLIDNGINHGPTNGAIHITVKVGDDMVNTYVCDEGQGLPPGEEERIFAQYYQVRHGSERHARGLGLGLFITRQIIEALGGRIWLDEADHTSFCFTIPVMENDAGPYEEQNVHLHGTPVT
jgi:signal transduction histidine kinase/PAS domain-containing protein